MRVFVDFHEDHKQGLEPSANYSFIKKKKKTLIRKKIVQLILQISLW